MSDEEIHLGPLEALHEGQLRIVQVGEVEVGVVRVGDQVRAFENHCPHQGGPVCYGEVLGRQEVLLDDRQRVIGERYSDERFDVICPWHGYTFDALSGECIVDPRLRLRRWEIVHRNGDVYLAPRTEPQGR